MESIKAIYDKNLKRLNTETKNIFTLVSPEGDANADFVIVLSSPTAYEEVVGITVDKKLKKEIEKIIASTGWDKESTYYTYAVKSCPYDFNKRGKIQYRDVNDLDIDLFREFLLEEIEFIEPKVVLAIGNEAFKAFASRDMAADYEESTCFNGNTLLLAYRTQVDLFSKDTVSVNKMKDFIFQRDGMPAPTPVLEKVDPESVPVLSAEGKREDYDLIGADALETKYEEDSVEKENLDDVLSESPIELDLAPEEVVQLDQALAIEKEEFAKDLKDDEVEISLEENKGVDEIELDKEFLNAGEEDNSKEAEVDKIEADKEVKPDEIEALNDRVIPEKDGLKPVEDFDFDDDFIPVMLLDRGMPDLSRISGFNDKNKEEADISEEEIKEEKLEEPEAAEKSLEEEILVKEDEELVDSASEDVVLAALEATEQISKENEELELKTEDELPALDSVGKNLDDIELDANIDEDEVSDKITSEELERLEAELNELAAEKGGEAKTEYIDLSDETLEPEEESYSEADKKLIKDVKDVELDEVVSAAKNEEVLEESTLVNLTENSGIISKIKHIVKKDEIVESEADVEVEAWADFNKENSDRTGNKEVLILYAGSGFKNDATKPVLETVARVFDDFNTSLMMLNINDDEFDVDLFLDILKTSKGLVIGSSVDWYGAGYKMQKLLDDIYYSGRIDLLHKMPTMLITISRNGYEDVTSTYLKNSLEILGAVVSSSLAGVIENAVYYDTNKTYKEIVEAKSEEFYRQISKGVRRLPSSLNDRKVFLKVSKRGDASEKDEDKTRKNKLNTYNEVIETQKKDIDEISEIFEEKLVVSTKKGKYSEVFLNSFTGNEKLEKSKICFELEDKESESFNLIIEKNKIDLIDFDKKDNDVIITLTQSVMNDIIKKKLTMQKSFLTGSVKVKGNFALLYKIDSMFKF